jgi:hypothetical protein
MQSVQSALPCGAPRMFQWSAGVRAVSIWKH